MDFFTAKEMMDAPVASDVRLINFDSAEVRPGFVNETFFLIVSGQKPYINMTVLLSPRIYVKQPEYWGIEVIGILPNIGLPALGPYVSTLPLDGIIGTKGIEVIGANRTERFDVP